MNIHTPTSFEYKYEDEKLLIQSLSKTGLISKAALLDIKDDYNKDVPYHNFLHALKVAEGVLRLPRWVLTLTETKSLFIAALFHDAGHTGTAQDLDEFRSLDIAFGGIMDFEKKYNYTWIDYSIVRKAIIGTVFKNRWKNTDKYAILLADLDISTIWMSFPEFLYFCDFPISIEVWVEISEWEHDVIYFKFLAGVDKNIFRSREVAEVFPRALENIKKYIQLDADIFIKLFHYYLHDSKNFSDFKKYYDSIT